MVHLLSKEGPSSVVSSHLGQSYGFTYRWRYVYAGESAAAILQTIADESALFFDHDLSAKNRFLNKRAAPNERISEEMYTVYRDGVLDGFYRELKARRGRWFAQKSRNAAKRLMDQIEAERRRAKRSLVQWLYSDAHMKVPRRNYAELKKRYAKEYPKGREPTPAQIRTRIREEWDIYHEELLSDRILQQKYQRFLGDSKRYIHLVDDSDFRLTFLRHVLSRQSGHSRRSWNSIRFSAVQPQREQVRIGVVIAKFLQNIEIGPRELPGGLHLYSIYSVGWGESEVKPLPNRCRQYIAGVNINGHGGVYRTGRSAAADPVLYLGGHDCYRTRVLDRGQVG